MGRRQGPKAAGQRWAVGLLLSPRGYQPSPLYPTHRAAPKHWPWPLHTKPGHYGDTLHGPLLTKQSGGSAQEFTSGPSHTSVAQPGHLLNRFLGSAAWMLRSLEAEDVRLIFVICFNKVVRGVDTFQNGLWPLVLNHAVAPPENC